MVRDFFAFMLNYVNGRARIAGTDEWIDLGDCWETKIRSALNRAQQACNCERADQSYSATLEWQKVFGYKFKGSAGLLKALLQA